MDVVILHVVMYVQRLVCVCMSCVVALWVKICLFVCMFRCVALCVWVSCFVVLCMYVSCFGLVGEDNCVCVCFVLWPCGCMYVLPCCLVYVCIVLWPCV